MWMNRKTTLVIAAIGLASMPTWGRVSTTNMPSAAVTSLASSSPDLSVPIELRTLKFNQLGYNSSIRLQGSESVVYVGFGSRLDEIVSNAALSFDFIPSPALLAKVSHIKVYFNNELMGVVPISDGQQGQRVNAKIPLDARLFSNYNQLKFELIGNASLTCANPNDASIWAELSQQSSIQLQVQKTQLENDLSLLPAPFFDERDTRPLVLPMVIGADANLGDIKAAGIAASYFGAMAKWRGTEFPLLKNSEPSQHAIVFMTNANKPDFLRDFPDADGPYLQVISHPTLPFVKLLLVAGRDSQDLEQAVKGLAFGQHLLTGPIAKITRTAQLAPRLPYDAPNWINTDRPVALVELTDRDNALQVEGYTPPPMTVSFRLPPDLFTWQSQGIPFDLSYRYSPPQSDASGSRMSLSINNQFVQAFNLNTSGESKHKNRLRVPLLDDGFLGGGDKVRIPAFQVGSQNELKFEFGFAASTGGESGCQTTQPSKQYAVIDASSAIDFSGFPHYIEMPNMRAFANSGYPFTRIADLAETAVVLPKNASVGEMEAYINVMGKLGVDTGYPAVNVTLTDVWSKAVLANKDILAIGVNPALQEVGDKIAPNLLLEAGRRLSQLPTKNQPQKGRNWVSPTHDGQQVADMVEVQASGQFAAIASYESPFTPHRTLVALMAESPASLPLINRALNDAGKVRNMYGTVISIRDNSVASFNVGQHYYVGQLPVWQLIMYHFSQRPILMAFAALLLVVLVTIALWRILRTLARRRIEAEDE